MNPATGTWEDIKLERLDQVKLLINLDGLDDKKIDKFIYPGTNRELVDGKRHYVISEEKLPSVTTILAATQSEEKRKN